MTTDDIYKPLFDAVVSFRDSLQRVAPLCVWYHEYKPTKGKVEFTFYFKLAETRMRGDVEYDITSPPTKSELEMIIIDTILDNLHWQTDPNHPWYVHNEVRVEKLAEFKVKYEKMYKKLEALP